MQAMIIRDYVPGISPCALFVVCAEFVFDLNGNCWAPVCGGGEKKNVGSPG